jgi:hypothetical protein
MAFKPNYNQQRAERNRAKIQKKQEKLKRLEEETAKRKAARGDEPGADAPADVTADAPADFTADAPAEKSADDA